MSDPSEDPVVLVVDAILPHLRAIRADVQDVGSKVTNLETRFAIHEATNGDSTDHLLHEQRIETLETGQKAIRTRLWAGLAILSTVGATAIALAKLIP